MSEKTARKEASQAALDDAIAEARAFIQRHGPVGIPALASAALMVACESGYAEVFEKTAAGVLELAREFNRGSPTQ